MRILVNAANVTGSGARSLALSLLPEFIARAGNNNLTLLLPDQAAFRGIPGLANTQAIFCPVRAGILNDLGRVWQLYWQIPRLIKSRSIDLCLTLGDLGPISPACHHILFLQQALLLEDPAALRQMSSWSWLKRIYLPWHFGKSSRKAAGIIVQTPVMANKCIIKYKMEPSRIHQIAQPVPRHIVENRDDQRPYTPIADCTKQTKLLFLASYYPNKNHQVLLSVAEELRRKSLADSVHIFLTLDETDGASARLREELRKYEDVVTNLGAIAPQDVARALRASSALFLPTLSESYGLIYLEAMACGVPILTSDRDFSRWICRDLALYFDPRDPSDMVKCIAAFKRPGDYGEQAAKRLLEFPGNWGEVADSFWRVISSSAAGI